ncbi:hypothetical protein CRE_22248 [Caenorhabditis remanei]|uniref:Uncharacterized protein n=1 Tax=Caenorhabditis remanei TaxID=31234 RepID=E3NT43_CAERE|nr:hypothetical protein CRE_22248 [Caenorhabditis remanei]
MSIDVYPSHEIDVRICVQNLRKCQTQTIGPRSWNRISARIKVQSTEKVSYLNYLPILTHLISDLCTILQQCNGDKINCHR